jgi:lipopolysaccharide biosynthesis protein
MLQSPVPRSGGLQSTPVSEERVPANAPGSATHERGVVDSAAESVRLLAFYLPQFHPIPENDRWWGTGFTEWTNVAKARSLFRGHYQPHIPADLGFCDLRVPEVREAQAALAREYGISGFCYYHYWFNGKRLLNRPFDEVLRSGRPDFPFCLCWANENWTRRWDGYDQEILIGQNHSLGDDREHIHNLFSAFEDRRYIRINGKPLFLVYRTEILPDAERTADVWRAEARAAGIGDLYLVRVESHSKYPDPRRIGFDAAVEFAPDLAVMPFPKMHRETWGFQARLENQLRKLRLLPQAYFDHHVYSYDDLVTRSMAKGPQPYTWFRCVTPSWDNSARRAKGATIIHKSSPELYERWLRAMVQTTVNTFNGDERLLFVNAWNEWAEGNHLEPDQRWGRAYLEATRRAVMAGVQPPRDSPREVLV